MAPNVPMTEKMALRQRVRKAVLAAVKEETAAAVSKRLGVSPRSIQLWIEGQWPNYTNAKRMAPMLGIKS
jgi:hypothetical protein